MIVRRFLLWCRVAPVAQRAEAVGALANAFLHSDLSADDRREAEAALTTILDDPSPVVRRALAEALAGATGAPRPIIVALASDQSDIAAAVLSRSPLLTDSDLVDCAAVGDGLAQTAIAMRPGLSVAVAAALAEVGAPEALAALARNRAVSLPGFSLRRMLERHGSDADVREALLDRADLPVDIRHSIVTAVAEALSTFVAGCRWLTPERVGRATREAKERSTIALAGGEPKAVPALVAHLRQSGHLTPALMLRALFCGEMLLVEAAFAELAGLPANRVAALLHQKRGAGFSALYRKAGLPGRLEPAFGAAMEAWHEAGQGEPSARLSRRMIERVMTACESFDADETGSLLALLRRFESEAAREEARELSMSLADEAALQMLIENDPQALVVDGLGQDASPLAAAA
jgi:uncharacterized protein (DUF2336 family)